MLNTVWLLLLQLTIIVIAARLAAAAARAIGQSPAVGEICAGLSLGPLVLGAFMPQLFTFLFPADGRLMLTLLSQLGLLLLMFQIGAEFDFAHLKDRALRRSVGVIGATSLFIPLTCGALFGYLSQPSLAPESPRVGFALLLAVAFGITALPILGRILMEMGLERSRIGVLAITIAAVTDLFSWLALLCFGLFAKALGTLGMFGALGAGLIVSSRSGAFAFWKRRVAPVVNGFLLPVFFTYTGLRIQIDAFDAHALGWCAALIALAMAAKFCAAYYSARSLGFDTPQAKALGVMMNTRGLMELVIANVGLDLGLFSPVVFGALIFMALLSTAMTTPLLRGLLPKFHSVAG